MKNERARECARTDDSAALKPWIAAAAAACKKNSKKLSVHHHYLAEHRPPPNFSYDETAARTHDTQQTNTHTQFSHHVVSPPGEQLPQYCIMLSLAFNNNG